MTFPQLANLHAGRPAVVIGKGPSLDAWLAAGCPQPAGAVRIGVNQVAALVPEVRYSVSGDCQMEHYTHLRTHWLRGVPYERPDGSVVTELPAGGGDWFDAETSLNPVKRADRLLQSREMLAATRRLFCELGSGNPAVHLAWYLGCDSLMLVGMDGGPARAQCLFPFPDRPGPPSYDKLKASIEAECDALFGLRWRHWMPPANPDREKGRLGEEEKSRPTGEKWKYDGIYGPGGLPGYGHSNHGANALEWLVERHTSVLDVGCGHNEFVKAWRESKGQAQKWQAIGCDFACPSADTLALATALPFGADSYDLVTAFDVLEHLPEAEVMPALREMARVARWYCFSIATRPSTILWQGQNLHPTVRPLDWWHDRIREAGGVSEMGPPAYVYGRWSEKTGRL